MECKNCVCPLVIDEWNGWVSELALIAGKLRG